MRASLLLLLAFNSLSTAQEKSAVFGVVRDSQTRQPIEGVTLYLEPYAFSPTDPLFPTLKLVMDVPLGFETVTDGAGRYRYLDLPSRRYCIDWRKPGYWRPTDNDCASTMVRTTAGRDLQHDLTLDRQPTLRGRFVDSSTNTPITGLRLAVLQQTYAGGILQWVTYFGARPDAGAGEFEITPPRGEFYLEIIPDETEKVVDPVGLRVSDRPFYGRSYYPGVTDITRAVSIVLTPGEDRFLEIRLPRQQPQTVNVEITAHGANPDARIQLALERRTVRYFPQTVARVSLNSGDPIALEGLSAADYTLIVWTDDGPEGRIGAVRQFSTGNRSNNRLKLDLEPTLTLRGVVRARPKSRRMPDGNVYLYPGSDERANPEDNSAVKVKIGEPFKISGVFPGKYHLSANAPPGWAVSRIAYGGVDAAHQEFTPDNTSNLVVTLSRELGSVTGLLTDANGPVDNAAVVLVPVPLPKEVRVNSFPWTYPDEKGRYEFKNVVPGRYEVVPFYGRTRSRYNDVDALREHAFGYREVKVLPRKISAGVDFTFR